MNRSKVICHMMVSIDGKIDGNYMDETDSEFTGDYYDTAIFQMGQAMAGGRITQVMYGPKDVIDYSKYDTSNISYEDYIILDKNGHYSFCYDRHGKSTYVDGRRTYGGVSMQCVAVLSKDVSKSYLAHLKSVGVSYIFVDTVLESLEKINQIFNVSTVVLTGGAIIHGGFLNEDVVDEISLCVAPYVEGSSEVKTIAETFGKFNNQAFHFASATPLKDGGVHLIFKRRA